ncbi:MAG: iron complex outerrane recepter protein [Verrucomicrobiota bacterium]|jgi:iron complex outermembrane receptor protein
MQQGLKSSIPFGGLVRFWLLPPVGSWNAKSFMPNQRFSLIPSFGDGGRFALPPLQSICFALALFVPLAGAFAQEAYRSPREGEPELPVRAEKPNRSPSELKKLPLEALVDVEITSASRRPEKLFETASAADVVTSEDIERAGVTNIPDALRLATEMEVAQLDGHSWAISTRGFDISTANKMQVLMDGRTLYTPLFSGVFWDVQQTFLPDLEQIEIIRGPGATLWGANAVNGVINIRTKSADETQGLLLYAGGGYELDGFGGIRYGGQVGQDTFYRVYVMHQSQDGLPIEGDDMEDNRRITQGGFRIDSKLNPEDTLTFQGDFYSGNFEQLNAGDINVDGENALGRWTRQLDKDSSLMVQAYYDRTYRLIAGVFEEERNTFDLEMQHQFRYGDHYIVYGGDYRFSHDNIGNLGPTLAFLPATDTQHLLSGYIQDEWHLVPDKFYLTAGSKFEYNSFSGFEIQPTGRFTWLITPTQTLWGAISRAVRTPTRVDQNLVAPNPAFGTPFLVANPDFQSETLVAYELGYRIKATSTLSFDIAGYYNDYDNLRSIEPLPDGTITIQNKLVGQSYGGSLAVKWGVTNWWRLDGSVSLLHVDIDKTNGGQDISNGNGEANDPSASFIIHSAMDLPWNLRFDSFLRYVDDLPHPATPAYLTADLRLAWAPRKNLEFAIVGRNLFDQTHPEFRTTPLAREVERSVFATVKWSY